MPPNSLKWKRRLSLQCTILTARARERAQGGGQRKKKIGAAMRDEKEINVTVGKEKKLRISDCHVNSNDQKKTHSN